MSPFFTFFVSPAAALLGVAAMVFMDWLVPYRSHRRQLNNLQTTINNLEAANKEERARADDAYQQLIHVLSAVNIAKAAADLPAERL